MKPVYLVGRALACTLGNSLDTALERLHSPVAPAQTPASGVSEGTLPYQRISGNATEGGWDARARSLIADVAQAAGAAQAHAGALFIAMSCQDGDAAEKMQRDMDFHALSGRIGEWLDWRGPVYLCSTACTSGIQALLGACDWLQAGLGTEALVLGVELDNRLTLPGFEALQLLSSTGSKPLGLHRDGLVLGEAVAALRLSSGCEAPWKLLGGANVVDGVQPTTASADAVTQMCRVALANCGLEATEVDLIKVQAAGSPVNDAAEAEGLRAAFAPVPALVSLKPLLGHCMGASGVAEIALLLECLEKGHWPRYPERADPALEVQLAQQAPANLRRILASILGFGGSHAAVVLERSAV